MSLDSDIDTFVRYIRDSIHAIGSIKVTPDGDGHRHRLFKRVLYLGVLETLAKTVSRGMGNRERFVATMRKFGGWRHAEKVSLPHLHRLMALAHQEEDLAELREAVGADIAKWRVGEVIRLERDLDEQRVKELWPAGGAHAYSVKDVGVDSLRQVHLLYSYRNFLVHELRTPGRGIDCRDTDMEPYYHSMSYYSGGSTIRSWELVYPISFMERLCQTILGEVEKHYRKEQVNPYDQFVFGSYWMDQLNI